MAYSTVTLTGTHQLPDGTPAQGTVEIIPSERQIIDDAGNVVLSGRVKVALNSAGSFSIAIPATDDVRLSPVNFGYTVVAKMHHTHLPAVSFSLPAAVSPVDITDVTTVDPSTFAPDANYVTPSELTALDDEIRAIQSSPDYYTTTRPIITFVDDDADPLYLDIWEPITVEKNIKISVAAIAGRVAGVFNPVGFPSMTLAQLQTIKAAGHDILSHGWEHLASYDAANTAEELYADWATAKQWFADNMPEAPEAQKVIVYPGGLAATEVAKKAKARQLYRYGITVSAPIGASSGNREPVDQFGVYRLNLDTATEATAKAAIDSAVALGTWLIFLTHDKELEAGGRAANMTKIRNVIDYAVAQGVPIMKFTDAEKVKGNAISVGEFTDQSNSTVISRRGKRRHTGAQGSWTPRLYGSTTPGTHTYTQQKGYYQVTGGMVTVKASISITAANLDAAMAGNLRIDGLPASYMPSTLDVATASPCNYNIFNLGTNYTTVWAKSGGTYLNLLRDGNNVAEAFLTSAQVVAGQTLNLAFTMTYMLSGDPAWV